MEQKEVWVGPFEKIRQISDAYDVNSIFRGGVEEETQKVFEYHPVGRDEEKDSEKILISGYDIYFDEKYHNEGLTASGLFNSLNLSEFSTRMTLQQAIDFCAKYPEHLKKGINLFDFLYGDGIPSREWVLLVSKGENGMLSSSSLWFMNRTHFVLGTRLIVPAHEIIRREKIF